MMSLLSGCATPASNLKVEIPLVQYSSEFQNKTADELEKMLPSCPLNTVRSDCSAVKTFIKDYKLLRDQVREFNK